MKRSKALAEIKWCGYHNDTQKAALITVKHGIGVAASRKAYIDGQKMKKWGEKCGCDSCKEKSL
ncbi:MAG: hypothetical protein LBI67_05575 [Treponema sp.]|jgi:hypothetical protein|nr:hypothetical protein [Treponema sp.]